MVTLLCTVVKQGGNGGDGGWTATFSTSRGWEMAVVMAEGKDRMREAEEVATVAAWAARWQHRVEKEGMAARGKEDVGDGKRLRVAVVVAGGSSGRATVLKEDEGNSRGFIKHSCINPKSSTFGYLDEKPIDTNFIKFSGLCILHLLSPFHDQLSLHEIKGSMTPRKSHHYGTITLPSPWYSYMLPCICVPFFVIGRSASMALQHSSESTSIYTDA
ncbi:hypothetical protein GW17_00054107 [Ensete ventricosum]|nr:hypothetical protein GW17_00054107 [Ensete ventricosum]